MWSGGPDLGGERGPEPVGHRRVGECGSIRLDVVVRDPLITDRAGADDQISNSHAALQATGRADAYHPTNAKGDQILQDYGRDRRADSESAADRDLGTVLANIDEIVFTANSTDARGVSRGGDLIHDSGLVADDGPANGGQIGECPLGPQAGM